MADIAAKISGIGQEYDAFLYAVIGADPNGSTLSVLSAIARMDLDPWTEAAQLSLLPTHAAVRRLSSLIFAMQVKPSVSGEPGQIAERLIKLLPTQSGAAVLARPLNKVFPNYSTQTHGRIALFAAVIMIMLALASLWSFIQRPASSPASAAHISATSTPSR